MSKLEEKTKEWMSLERKTSEQRVIADDFYEHELMKLIMREFNKNNKDMKSEEVEYIIMSVGTSYEPLVLTLSLFKPRKILFLYTSETECMIDKIVNMCKLSAGQYSKKKVSQTSSLDVYREIKNAYIEWNMPEKLYIDFTGGTKSMSAAAAMAGAMVDVQLFYVSNENYLNDFRKPYPGSERMCFIANPYEVFGDFEIEKAMNLFSEYDYAGAAERLGNLCEKVPNPLIRQQLRFIHLLSRTYEAWDSLDFAKAHESMEQLVQELHRDQKIYPNIVLMDQIPQLQKQLVLLSNLIEIPQLLIQNKNMEILTQPRYIVSLMFTMYRVSSIREAQEKYDAATLMLYRLLEMIGQCRLAKYQIDVGNPEYHSIQYHFEQTPEYQGVSEQQQLEKLQDSVYRIRQQIFTKAKREKSLTLKIALMDGFILLLALKDQLVFSGDLKESIKHIQHTRAMVQLRNSSIFAHGFSPVSVKNYEKFKTFVIDLFKEFCNLEPVDFEQWEDGMKWINPKDSQFYTLGVR